MTRLGRSLHFADELIAAVTEDERLPIRHAGAAGQTFHREKGDGVASTIDTSTHQLKRFRLSAIASHSWAGVRGLASH
jgi:hypothetical protein